MEYRKLGNTSIAVSTLTLGTMYFGSETSEEEAFALLDAFMEAGGNLIDTANVYVGGMTEEIIGRWLASRPREITDRVILATKGRGATNPDVNGAGLSRRRLGRETIDLYQLHAWDPLTPVEETLSFLDAVVRAGKIHYVGLSNFTGWQLQLMVSTARQMGVQLPVTLQQQYSLLSRESEWEVVPAALHNGIGLLPWSPLAGGFLAGKYQRGDTPAADTRVGSDKPLYQYVSAEYAASDRNWATIDAVVRIAREIDASPAQVALSWIAEQPGVISPIFGARNMRQLTDNLGAADLHLDADATAVLNAVSAPSPGGYPYGAFGSGQRARSLDGRSAQQDLIGEGSDAPLGRR